MHVPHSLRDEALPLWVKKRCSVKSRHASRERMPRTEARATRYVNALEGRAIRPPPSYKCLGHNTVTMVIQMDIGAEVGRLRCTARA